jgi:hypothetical protein
MMPEKSQPRYANTEYADQNADQDNDSRRRAEHDTMKFPKKHGRH